MSKNNQDLLLYAYNILKDSSPTPILDAQILLAFITNKSRVYCISHNDIQNKELVDEYIDTIQKRSQGIPIPYITGIQEFWSLPIIVSRDTLIPRADTELLVEIILNKFKDINSLKVLELGTGSGAIACALAHTKPSWEITATDLCAKAIKIAQTNAKNLKCSNINFIVSDWFNNIANSCYDLIVSNPPYIAENDIHLKTSIRYEPQSALIGGAIGTENYNIIFKNAKNYLKPNASIIVEHGSDQKDLIISMLKQYNYCNIKSWKDISGNDRVISSHLD